MVDQNLDEQILNFANEIALRIPQQLDNIFSFFITASNVFLAFIIVIAMTFMILAEWPKLKQRLRDISDKEKFEKWQTLGNKMSEVITGYVNGQLLVALIGGTAASLFMLILQIPNAIALGVLVAFFALIPLIGALIGAIIVIALTFLVNINSALILIVYFIAYQQIENITIQPWIQGQQTNLTTLQVFITALIGASIAGIAGAILAIPLAGCLKILILAYLEKRIQT